MSLTSRSRYNLTDSPYRNLRVLGIAVAVLLRVTVTGADEETELTDAAYSSERIAALVGQLDSDDPEERFNAINDLFHLGPEARHAIPRLIDLLADEEYGTAKRVYVVDLIYYAAQRALTAIGAETVGPLASWFPDEPETVQSRSVRTARLIGPDAREMFHVIHERYTRSTEWERREALSTLAKIDPTGEQAVPILLAALQEDPDAEVRRTAALFLQRTPRLHVYWPEDAPAAKWFEDNALDPAMAADALREALGDESPGVRAVAARALAGYPESADRSIPLLVELLTDPEEYWVQYSNHVESTVLVATEAASALSAFPEYADESMPRLVQAALSPEISHGSFSYSIGELAPHCDRPHDHVHRILDSEHPELALLALARLGTADEDAKEKVVRLMSNHDELVVQRAATALCCIDADAYPKALQIVRESLKETDIFGFAQDNVCEFIDAVGPNAEFAAPILRENIIDMVLRDHLNGRVVRALAAIGPAEEAIPEILDRIGDRTVFQPYCEDYLVDFGPTIVPVLMEALDDETRSAANRISCLRVAGRIGSDAAEAVSSVIRSLDSEYPRVRQAAAAALGGIAANPDLSLPALTSALQDPRPLVRAAAVTSIAAFDAEAKESIPLLVDALNDDYLAVQAAAIDALGSMGGLASDAVPALEELAEGDNYLLRELASDALLEIRGV